MKYFILSVIFVVAIFPLMIGDIVNADNSQIKKLQEQIDELKQEVQYLKNAKVGQNNNSKQTEGSEIQRLRNSAQVLESSNNETKDDENISFQGGQTSQQVLNPEISVTGDFLSSYINGRKYNRGFRDGSNLRVAALHIQSDLDPFSFAKFALEFHEDGAELGEGYITWSGVFPDLSITLGKFRQQFGVVNRWHLHSLDQTEYPLALTTILGDDGLVQRGVSFDWQMPRFFGTSNELTVQVTNGENDHLFAGSKYGKTPSILGHLKNFFELNNGKYMELGFTGMVGNNNQFGVTNAAGKTIDESKRLTKLYGIDFSYSSIPPSTAHYSNWEFKSEFYFADKALINNNRIKAHGLYAYLQKRMNERLYTGLRYDWTRPFTQNNDNDHIYQVVPYITYWQSHWMRTRLEYAYKKDTRLSEPDHRINLQFTWAMGPHKHERY